MPALANIAIQDGAATPVTHTFSPSDSDNGKSTFANSAPGVPMGYEVLDITFVRPKTPTAAFRILGKLVLPTIASVNGVQTITSKNTVNFDVNLDQRSTAQERKNAVVLLKNLFANTDFVSVAEKLENYY